MSGQETAEWDENLAQQMLERRVAVGLWYFVGPIVALVVISLIPKTVGMLVAAVVMFVPLGILDSRVRGMKCPRCRTPLFGQLSWTKADIFIKDKCAQCGLSYSFAPFVDKAHRAKQAGEKGREPYDRGTNDQR